MIPLCTEVVDIICPGLRFCTFKKHLLNMMTKGFDIIKNLPFHRSDEEKLGQSVDILFDWSNKLKKSLLSGMPYSMRV